MAKLIINPIVQYFFENYVILVGVVVGCFGTPFGEMVFKCWGSALHFGDPLEEISTFFISNMICMFLNNSKDLNISTVL